MAGDGVPYQPQAATLDFEDRDRTVSLPEQRFGRVELPDARAIDRLRTDAVERQSPRIEVEHQVGKDPPVVGRDTSAVIDGARRRVESDLTFFRQRNLQARVSEELVLVGGAIYNPAQARMHERDVQLLE